MDNDEYRNVLPLGMQLQDYRILKVLGMGGFGVTYQAEDIRLKAKFAIKEYMPSELAVRRTEGNQVCAKSTYAQQNYKKGLEGFLLEAQTLARFKHPNIVRVVRIFEACGTAYMVQEYEQGRTLEAWLLERGGRIGEKALSELLWPLLDALEHLHEHGLLHRDISLDNIYVRDNGKPVLLDFGAARYEASQRSRSVTSIVKAGYSPPEQYTHSSKQGPWTDIYALGAVLHYAIRGETVPESSERLHELSNSDVDPYRPLSGSVAGYAPHFLDAVDWSLRLRKNERPQAIAAWRAVFKGENMTAAAGPSIEPRARTKINPTSEARARSAAASGPDTGNRGPWYQIVKATLAVLLLAALLWISAPRLGLHWEELPWMDGPASSEQTQTVQSITIPSPPRPDNIFLDNGISLRDWLLHAEEREDYREMITELAAYREQYPDIQEIAVRMEQAVSGHLASLSREDTLPVREQLSWLARQAGMTPTLEAELRKRYALEDAIGRGLDGRSAEEAMGLAGWMGDMMGKEHTLPLSWSAFVYHVTGLKEQAQVAYRKLLQALPENEAARAKVVGNLLRVERGMGRFRIDPSHRGEFYVRDRVTVQWLPFAQAAVSQTLAPGMQVQVTGKVPGKPRAYAVVKLLDDTQGYVRMEGLSRKHPDVLAERHSWEETTKTDTADAYRKYLEQYPVGEYAGQAERRIKKIREQDEKQAREKASREEIRENSLDEPGQEPRVTETGEVSRNISDMQAQTTEPSSTMPRNPPSSAEGTDGDGQEKARTYVALGIAKYELQQYEAAIKDYSNAIRNDANHASAYFGRANAKYALNQYSSAIEDYSNVILLDPNDAKGHYNRGNANYQLKQYEKAIIDYSNAIRVEPDYAGAYFGRGNAKHALEQYESAVEDFSHAIRIDPNYAKAYNNRGNSRYELGQYESASEDYSSVIRINPSDARAYRNRCYAKRQLGRKKDAIKDCSRALEIDSRQR